MEVTRTPGQLVVLLRQRLYTHCLLSDLALQSHLNNRSALPAEDKFRAEAEFRWHLDSAATDLGWADAALFLHLK